MTHLLSQKNIIADVLVPVAVDTAYSYAVPSELHVNEGDCVTVPLGTRQAQGIIWALREGESSNLKSIISRNEPYTINKNLRQFIDWVARWTLSSRGMVMKMALPRSDYHSKNTTTELVYQGTQPTRMTPARQRLIGCAQQHPSGSKSFYIDLAKCSPSVLEGLINEGHFIPKEKRIDVFNIKPQADFVIPTLEPSQKHIADLICKRVADQKFSVTLLEGVTGSGKTEVYFEAIAQAIRQQQQTLILVPEIALTAQFLERFKQRFGVQPAAWHSSMSEKKRAQVWEGIASNNVRVVVGARSALFLPFTQLGLIIIDEEHESAYKQEDGVIYHARDMAIVRAQIENISIILASATPSIETRVNALQGKFHHDILEQRFGGRSLPQLTAIDLHLTPPLKGRWISPPLVAELEKNLEQGQQSLLFLNRRGYAPLTLCRSCGFRFQCPTCSSWLVEHRHHNRLMCHHCGYHQAKPHNCPSCHEADQLTACGPGVERLAEEVESLFPHARHLTLASDHLGHESQLQADLARIERGEVDIIIGTQLVAKGHNFPHLTLVGVVDADIGLANGDPRATERTFQMLQQVTGRAGRGIGEGRGILQSWQPKHPVMQALLSGDKETFYREEIKSRQIAELPPYTRLAALIISHKDRSIAEQHARSLARSALNIENWGVKRAGEAHSDKDFVIFGPAEAPLALLRGKYRFRLLIKAPRQLDLQSFIRAFIHAAPKAASQLKVTIDIDPQSFL